MYSFKAFVKHALGSELVIEKAARLTPKHVTAEQTDYLYYT